MLFMKFPSCSVKFACYLRGLHVVYKFACALVSMHAIYKGCMCSVKFACYL